MKPKAVGWVEERNPALAFFICWVTLALTQPTTTPPPPPDDENKNNLSSSEKKEIRFLEKRISEHQEKIVEFKQRPTIRFGMENQPKEVIRAVQERRILHLEREIKAFQTRVDLLKGKAK